MKDAFRSYPFRVGEKIHIEDGPRRGDWEVVGVSEASFTDNTMLFWGILLPLLTRGSKS